MRSITRDVGRLLLIVALGFGCAKGTDSSWDLPEDNENGHAGDDPWGEDDDEMHCSDDLHVVCDGVCVQGTCDFAVTSIVPASPGGSSGGASDWVNGGTFFTLGGHGFAKGMRVYLGDGRAPVRVVDGATATIQAPPGPEGVTDIRIELGEKTSVTLGAFTYYADSVDDTTPWVKLTTSTPHADVPSIGILADGRALVTGGFTSFNPHTVATSADVFSLAAKATMPTANDMSTARWNHATVTLLTGKTILLGASGVSMLPCCDSLVVELFDPVTNSFSKSKGVPKEFLQGPRAILLVDGRVLVLSYMTEDAEIYDPETDSFELVAGAPTIDYLQYVGLQYLTRLRDGRVLIVTGQGKDAYFFDSDAGTFSVAGKGPAAGPDGLFTLPDGRIMAIGGSVVSASVSNATATIELFDPEGGGSFTPAPYSLLAPRVNSATAMERDGSILVIGGAEGSFPVPYQCGDPNADEKVTASVDRIDPVAGKVTKFPELPEPNSYLVAATLLEGSVVAAGGAVCGVAEPYPSLYFRQAPPPNLK